MVISYDNFRNGFWNPSTFDSGSRKKYSIYLKKVVIYFEGIIFIQKRS